MTRTITFARGRNFIYTLLQLHLIDWMDAQYFLKDFSLNDNWDVFHDEAEKACRS